MNHQKLIKYINIKEGLFFCVLACHLTILAVYIMTTFWLRNYFNPELVTEIHMLTLAVAAIILSAYTAVAMRIGKHYLNFIINNRDTFHQSAYRYPKPITSKSVATAITYLLPIAWIFVTYLPYELYGKVNLLIVLGNLITALLAFLTLKIISTTVHETSFSIPEPDSLDKFED